MHGFVCVAASVHVEAVRESEQEKAKPKATQMTAQTLKSTTVTAEHGDIHYGAYLADGAPKHGTKSMLFVVEDPVNKLEVILLMATGQSARQLTHRPYWVIQNCFGVLLCDKRQEVSQSAPSSILASMLLERVQLKI